MSRNNWNPTLSSRFGRIDSCLTSLKSERIPYFIIYAAGLPKIAKFVGVAKSYAERLFSFVEIDSLDAIAAEKALVYPAKEMGVAYTPKAINHILSTTKGYPYFIQEYGKWLWKHRHNSDIIIDEIAVAAYNDFEKSLDSGFFRVRYDKATTKELDFMLAMVECGELPCTIKNVAEILGVTQQRISAVRAQLIHKGFIYAANYGKLDFMYPSLDNIYADSREILHQIHKK